MARYFEYGEVEIEYLKSRDKKLAVAIDAVGHVYREMEESDLFGGVIHHIIGQQISAAAQATVWARMKESLGIVIPETVGATSVKDLQKCGITFRKAEYIKSFAVKVESGAFDIKAVEHMTDVQAITALCTLDGIGTWTAEMLLLFNLGRTDILSFGDFAIHRGMRMVYHHRKVTRQMFERHRRCYSPYGSVASLYLWTISHKNIPGFNRDFALNTKADA